MSKSRFLKHTHIYTHTRTHTPHARNHTYTTHTHTTTTLPPKKTHIHRLTYGQGMFHYHNNADTVIPRTESQTAKATRPRNKHSTQSILTRRNRTGVYQTHEFPNPSLIKQSSPVENRSEVYQKTQVSKSSTHQPITPRNRTGVYQTHEFPNPSLINQSSLVETALEYIKKHRFSKTFTHHQ